MQHAEAELDPFAEWLEAVTREKGILKEDMSRAIGKSHGYAHGITNGHFRPSRAGVVAIAKYLKEDETTALILAGYQAPPPDTTATEVELLAMFRGLTPAKRRVLMDYIRFMAKTK